MGLLSALVQKVEDVIAAAVQRGVAKGITRVLGDAVPADAEESEAEARLLLLPAPAPSPSPGGVEGRRVDAVPNLLPYARPRLHRHNRAGGSLSL